MKKYYYIEDEIQNGPFTFQELSKKSINKKTLIWSEDMDNWEEAKNLIELSEIIKITPPPLPNKATNPIKVEAEIIRKKEKIITPEREIIIAKETKRIFKNIIYILISSIILFFILFGYHNGISNFLIRQKLQNDLDRGTPYYNEVDSRNAERQILKDESERLGYYYDKEAFGGFDTYQAIYYHKGQINYAINKATKPALIFSLLMFLILIIGKYIFNGAKWVDKKSKTEM
jgi:hypothetical protein